jgi:hypothetical protein
MEMGLITHYQVVQKVIISGYVLKSNGVLQALLSLG